MITTRKCVFCGADVRSDERKCPACGAPNELYVHHDRPEPRRKDSAEKPEKASARPK